MSNITIKPNDSGIGEIKITGPNTNDTRYQLLPDVSGNVVVSDGSLLTVSHSASEVKFGGRTDITGAIQGFHKWEIVSSNTTLTVNRNYFANTRGQSDLTLTLPASANIGDTIQVMDNEGFSSSNNIFIANGTSTQTIDGGVRRLTLTTDRESVKLFYTGTGWVSKQQETTLPTFQGTISGYTSGGSIPAKTDTIDKFPLASDANATDVGDITQSRSGVAGQSSTVSGYTSGGNTPTIVNTIDKFPFATDGNATDVGDLTQARSSPAGQSSIVSGYSSGGSPPGQTDIIDKFPFAVDGNATDVGDLFQARRGSAGQSSKVSGYTSGGFATPEARVTIDKFPFASDANATDVGDITQARNTVAGQSSTVFGYSSGGIIAPGPRVVTIDKFPFASDTNATDVGDITQARNGAAGQSSETNGYTSGGNNPTILNTIDKFPFASDTNATDVGNLTEVRVSAAGQQV